MRPSRLSRSKPLGSDREHNFPDEPGANGCFQCSRCGRPTTDPERVRSLCPGMKQTRLSPVSDRRDEKREKLGARGPLCDFVRGRECSVPGCTAPSDPCHVRPVGRGYGDFIRVGGEWVGNVADFCRQHHDEFDGRVVGHGGRDEFEEEHRVDGTYRAWRVGRMFHVKHGTDRESETHPYRQLRETA